MSDDNEAGLCLNRHPFPTDRSKPKKGYAWLVWALAAISFGYAFFQLVTPSVMASDLMAEFAIGGAMLGTLSALYFILMCCCKFRWGHCWKQLAHAYY